MLAFFFSVIKSSWELFKRLKIFSKNKGFLTWETNLLHIFWTDLQTFLFSGTRPNECFHLKFSAPIVFFFDIFIHCDASLPWGWLYHVSVVIIFTHEKVGPTRLWTHRVKIFLIHSFRLNRIAESIDTSTFFGIFNLSWLSCLSCLLIHSEYTFFRSSVYPHILKTWILSLYHYYVSIKTIVIIFIIRLVCTLFRQTKRHTLKGLLFECISVKKKNEYLYSFN